MGTLFDRWLNTCDGLLVMPPDVLDELRGEAGLPPIAVDRVGEEFPYPADAETVETVARTTGARKAGRLPAEG